jgi:hypothetical protein
VSATSRSTSPGSTDPRQLRRALDDRPERRPAQRPQRARGRRQRGQLGVDQNLLQELRAQRRHGADRACEGRAEQPDEASTLVGGCLGDQLLELVDDEKQPSPPPGRREQELVGEVGEPVLVEPPLHHRGRPGEVERVRGVGHLAGQRGAGGAPRQDRREHPPAGFIGEGWREPGPDQGGLPQPDGPTRSSTPSSAG